VGNWKLLRKGCINSTLKGRDNERVEFVAGVKCWLTISRVRRQVP
jgi:hypothetical protein